LGTFGDICTFGDMGTEINFLNIEKRGSVQNDVFLGLKIICKYYEAESKIFQTIGLLSVFLF
jgi:hypothetical protein